jgi:hypothetical protein
MMDDEQQQSQPPHDGKKGSFWQKHKVEIIAAIVGIAVTVYLYYRSKNSTASTTSATAAPTDLETPSGVGGGGSGGGGYNGYSGNQQNQNGGGLSAAITALEGEVTSLQSQIGQMTTTPIVNVTVPAQTAAVQTNTGTASNAPVINPGATGTVTNNAGNAVGPADITPSWATTTFTGSNGTTYFGAGTEKAAQQAIAAGYTQTNAQAIGVPDGTTKAKYFSKS